jgi:hypothetical protein
VCVGASWRSTGVPGSLACGEGGGGCVLLVLYDSMSLHFACLYGGCVGVQVLHDATVRRMRGAHQGGSTIPYHTIPSSRAEQIALPGLPALTMPRTRLKGHCAIHGALLQGNQLRWEGAVSMFLVVAD